MESRNSLVGIILAAGYSSRMKDFKPLMPIGDGNALTLQIDSMKNAGIKDIYVVVGYNADVMEMYLSDKEVNTVFNENFQNGMFTSVKAGIQAAGEIADGYILMLVDSPLIPPYVIKNVIKHQKNSPESFIVPCFMGKKGHPLYIPSSYRDEILGYDGEGGLKAITDRYFDRFIRLEMNCEGVVLDMDTRENYDTLLKYYDDNRYPSREKCEQLQKLSGTPAHVVRHCNLVTEIALRIAYALNEKGYSLNIDLLRAAGLLHDVLRTKKKHWEEGAQLCRDYGYDEVADIINVHMNYFHSKVGNDFDETDIICLADKLCIEDRFATFEERMEPVRKRWAKVPDAIEAIEMKLDAALFVKGEIERIIGRTVEELMNEPDPDTPRNVKQRQGRKVYLIRHGETQKHKEPIFMGQIDVPLDSEGKEQSARAGIELQKQQPQTSKVYCSDLKRSRDSAKIIAGILESKPEIVEIEEFREMALGDWDGKFIREIMEAYPNEYNMRGDNLLSYKIGNDSENYYDLQYRVMKKFNELRDADDEDIIIVGHAGVNKIIMCNLLNKSLSELFDIKFERGQIRVLDL